MDLNAQFFCLPYSTFTMDLNAQMSQLLAIQDNQPTIPVCMPDSNGTGADDAQQNSHDAGSELFQAASSGNVLMAQALLSATGAQSCINYTDGHGCTCLFKAACNVHVPIVVHLMAAHCNVDLARTDGAPPLYVVAFKGHSPIVSRLITTFLFIMNQ
jgi:hypothetical protein